MSDRRQDSNAISIALVTGEAAIKKTFAVMVQLRPGLEKKEYVQRVQRQQIGGYLLANLMRVDTVKAVVQRIRDHGVIVGPIGTSLEIAPPLIAVKEQLDECVRVCAQSIDEIAKERSLV